MIESRHDIKYRQLIQMIRYDKVTVKDMTKLCYLSILILYGRELCHEYRNFSTNIFPDFFIFYLSNLTSVQGHDFRRYNDVAVPNFKITRNLCNAEWLSYCLKYLHCSCTVNWRTHYESSIFRTFL